MKKQLLLLMLTLLCSVMTWADEVSYVMKSYDSTNKVYTATDDQDGVWSLSTGCSTSNQLPASFGATTATARGICFSKPSNVTVTSKTSFTNVTKIVVEASSNIASGTGTIAIKVGTTSLGSKNLSKTNHTTYEFTSATPLSGEITLTANQGANSVWIGGFKVTTSGSDTPVTEKYSYTLETVGQGTVVFKDANGNTIAENQQVDKDTKLTPTYSPAEGYEFTSWEYYTSTGEWKAVNGTEFAITKDVKFRVTFTETQQGGEDGDNLTVTYNFNDPNAYSAGFPTGGTNTASAKTFKISGNDIVINAPTTYYIVYSTDNVNRGLFFGKTSTSNSKPQTGTAYLGFPAKEGYKLTKVVATSTAYMPANLPLNIYTTSLEAVSTASNTVNGAKTAHTFVINEPAENTEYWLTAGGTSGKNLQFDNIVLTYEKVEAPVTPTPTYSEAKALNVTANNGQDYYFTTFSSDKVTFFPEYDDEFTFATSIKTAEVADDIFVLTQIKKGTATIDEEEVEGFFVPAKTGVLVQAEYDGKAEMNVPYYEVENMTVAALENNDLQAGNGEMLPSGKVWYKLAWADAYHTPSTLGFYYGAAEGAPFTSTKGKAYLGLTSEQAAKKISFSLADDETTSIKTIETVNGASAVYNLAGQRVAPNAKGIVIVNGKKMLNK